jgi:diacylglycerol kinase (ATP)
LALQEYISLYNEMRLAPRRDHQVITLKLLLIFNPHAAMGRAAKMLPRIQSGLGDFAELVTLVSRHPGHARELVSTTKLTDFDGVVAAGGDGTLFEVLNGLYQHERQCRRPLGLIPTGTGNAFARDLGLMPGDWSRGIDIIRAGRLRSLDVGRVESDTETFHFVNIIGLGFPVDALRTSKKLKIFGNSAYTLATLREVLRLKSYRLLIEIDGTRIEEDNVFVEISNTRYTGTSFLIAPAARLDDGLFDITLLRKLPKLRLLRLFPTIYSGAHVGFEEVTTRTASKVKILRPQHRLLAPDGELHGETPVTVTCLRQDLEIYSS